VIRLLRGRVRIRPDDPPKRIGSIIIPDTVVQQDPLNRKLARTGVVVQVGAPAVTKRGHEVAPGFREGDRVVYQFGQIDIEGDAMCAQSEILAVVEGDFVPAISRES